MTPLDGPWRSEVLSGPVEQWRLDHRLEGAEAWTPVLCGQGTWAWLTGPDGKPAPVRYSLSRGIQDDPLHAGSFGPKGRVPEEFWHVDAVAAGQAVALRTSLSATTRQPVTLAVAANGAKDVWWNGRRLAADPGGYLRLDGVDLVPGPNVLDVRVTAEITGALRGYWAVTTDAAAFARPSWIAPADGTVAGTAVTARRTVVLDARPSAATLQLGTQGSARLSVNGCVVATHGDFDSYGNELRVQPYDVASYLDAGENLIEVELADTGNPVALFVDAYADAITVVSDASWSLTRNGVPVVTSLARSHPYDPRWAMLRPRPHPLPRAAWLDGAPDGGVLDLTPDASPGRPRPAEWFRVPVPPGAVSASLPVVGENVQAWLDGIPVPLDNGSARLDGPEREGRILTVRVIARDGRTEGALWDGPPAFDVTHGSLSPGEWAAAGLGSYSGGVAYSRTLRLDRVPSRALLDLGAVRGTAEVAVNGVTVGTRIWSPYRVDITSALCLGDNDIRVTVRNTLAPHLDDTSPTTMVYAGQRVSGLLGPVRLLSTVEGM